MTTFILVIDDDEKIISLLRRSLTFEGYEVWTATNGKQGLEILQTKTPDLIILDVMMPKLDGWEVCKCLRAAGVKAPVLMLTARDEITDRVKGLNLGADDYIVKPFALEELIARVRAHLRRNEKDTQEQDEQYQFADLYLNVSTREIRRNNRDIELTAKEFELLVLFLQNPRRVLSRDLLMERIWGFDFSGESNVLEVYVAMLRQKLEERGEKRLIQTIRGTGYMMKEEH